MVRVSDKSRIHPQVGSTAVGGTKVPTAEKAKTAPSSAYAKAQPQAAKTDFKGFVGSSRFGGNVVDQIVTALTFGSMKVDDLAVMFKRDVEAGILANAHLNEAKAKVVS